MTHGLTRIYKMGRVEVVAIQDISLTVEKGEFLSIVGPSGSGKSTLMHILGCLERPSRGEYSLEGTDVAELKDGQLSELRSRRIGFVFQTLNLIPRKKVFQNVELPLIYGGIPRRKRKTKVEGALLSVGLTERANHHPSELSGGERQRVAIARALVNNPSLILADEPTGNLDSQTGRQIISIFKELNQRGNTVILTTHNLEIARQTNRIISLRDGMIEKEERL
ncbi:MAG: ABC transporter ATP-binding protein [bacterium]